MVRKEVFKLAGLFNSRLFPIHYEESDFCNRIRRAGYKVIVVPSAKIWHDVPPPERSKTLVKSPLRAYYTARNRILFHWRWSKNIIQRLIALLMSFVITVYYVITILRSSSNNRNELIKSMIKGVIDGFKMLKFATR
jgi:hypothetical protein